MQQYIIRRILQAIPLLLGITMITFGIMQLAPGNPLTMLISPDVPPEEVARAEERLGLHDPIYVQYFRWLTEMFQGNFGYTLAGGRSISREIVNRFPATFTLSVTSMLITFTLALPLGVISALKRGSFIDRLLTTFTFTGVSMPGFFLGLGLIFIFAVNLGWFPTSGMGTIGRGLSGWAVFSDRLRYLVLPAFTLAIPSLASVVRFTRSSMLDVLSEDYMRTARSKGLRERIVIYKHGLRNALIPVITILGGYLPFLFSGAYIVEQVFSWPGMGRLGIQAIYYREYGVIMALNVVTSALVLLGNLMADIMYAVVDPRIRYS